MAQTLRRSEVLGYVSLCVIWGSTWLAIRVVVRAVPPLEAAAVRFLAAAVLLLSLAAAQKRSWPNTRAQWTALVVLSVTMMAAPYGLIFWAEQYVTSSMTAVLFSAIPLLVALLTPLMMHRSVPRRAVFALVVAFGGLLVLFYSGLGTSGGAVLGGLAVLLAVLLSAWSVVYAKQPLQRIDAVISTGLQFLFGSVALCWATWAMEPRRQGAWTLNVMAALAFLVVFGSCAAFVIYYWLLQKMQPYQLSTISLITPIIAVLEGSLLMHEPVPLLMVFAIGLVLGSVATVLLSPAEPQIGHSNVLLVRESAGSVEDA